jgi:Family of unknown function (DUF6527)
MTRQSTFTTVFTTAVPGRLENGVLYVSRQFNTAMHLCMCGCGREVVTPLSSAGWRLIERGKRISLYPSVGNWSFPCQSHYWLQNNRVSWAETWSKERIERGRRRDEQGYDRLYSSGSPAESPSGVDPTSSWWRRLVARWRDRRVQ